MPFSKISLSQFFNPTEIVILRVIGKMGGNISPYHFKKESNLGISYPAASRYCHILEDNGFLASESGQGLRKSKLLTYSISITGLCGYILILYSDLKNNKNKFFEEVINALKKYSNLSKEIPWFLDVLNNLKLSVPIDIYNKILGKILIDQLIEECTSATTYHGIPNFEFSLLHMPLLPSFWASTSINEHYPEIFEIMYKTLNKHPEYMDSFKIFLTTRDLIDLENELYFEFRTNDPLEFINWFSDMCKKYSSN